MIFREGSPLYSTEFERRQGENVMYVNYLGANYVPSIADDSNVMARTIDVLMENPDVSRIVFVQQRNYNYSSGQIFMLAELARLYNYLTKQQNILSPEKISLFGDVALVHGEIGYLLTLLRQDPVACYLSLKKLMGNIRESEESVKDSRVQNYLRFLDNFKSLMENTGLIRKIQGELEGYPSGSREIYRNLFRPDVLPNFTFTRLVAQLPENVELVDQYSIKGDMEEITVTILRREDDPKYLYHVMPPEYTLSEEHHMLLNLARNVMIEHRPKAEEFIDPGRTRQVFFNVARDLLTELSKSKKGGIYDGPKTTRPLERIRWLHLTK